MTEVQKVHLEPARNAAHYELVHQIQEFAEACCTVQTHMQAEYAAYKAAVDEEGRILGISLRSDLTQELADTDRERDWAATGSKAIYEALQYDADPAIAEAARAVLNQFKSLKVDTKSNYLQQTGEIDILLSALFGEYAQQVETCKMQELSLLLKRANERMHDLLNERDLIQAPRVGTAMTEARATTDATFRAFFRFYNAWILINADTATEEEVAACELFSTQSNTKIDYFKRYVLKQNGTTKPSDGEEGEEEETEGEETGSGGAGTEQKPSGGTTGTEQPGEGEQQPTLYKITYKHKGQVYAVQEYEVGAKITTIDPPEGYYWRETTPGVMPAHDITITSTDDPYGIL